jgi:D-tagatose-1,6-bisphosphate aldolase subunit GatZ/KbaZ
MSGPWKTISTRAAAADVLMELGRANRDRPPLGVYSICSANRLVLEAGMTQAARDSVPVLIESTANQVNQFRGYSGMTPLDFRSFVSVVADEMGFPRQRVILGGDHLGPYPWRNEPAKAAMAKGRELVRACVLAGYAKIHLDASVRCGDDPPQHPLDEQIVSERTAELCGAAEAAYGELLGGGRPRWAGDSTAGCVPPPPAYVIGSEVPIPGGELARQSAPDTTRSRDVERTLGRAKRAFRGNLESAWERVIAVVVQPSVEFGDTAIFDYDRSRTAELSSYIEHDARLVYEAHSTDYQTPDALREMVEDHFAILKVGPGLTFAMREAIFALDSIEQEWSSSRRESNVPRLREVLQQVMIDHPEHWQAYYDGDDAALRFARDFSLSDRSRYYWHRPEMQDALKRLISDLSGRVIPLTLLSQYFPLEYPAVRAGMLPNEPRALIRQHVLAVIDAYASACGMR